MPTGGIQAKEPASGGMGGRISFTDKNLNGVIDVTTNSSTNEILQENHYYAFGMTYDGPWMINDAAKDNPYQYNGKELNLDHGLNWSDYGARWYDACVGRWTSVDPLADKYPGMSPYNYVGNNPINAIDIKGDSITPLARAIVGDDNQGFITTATTEHRENAPISAGFKDASYAILSAMGLNVVDDLIFGSGPVTERLVNAASQILTPVPSKMPKVKGPLNGANKVDYVVTPKGETIKIPDGATGPTNPQKGSGMVYQNGSGGKGMDKRTTGVRIMDANQNQGKRVNYMNKDGQTVDPSTGRTISNKDKRGHIPLKDF